MIEICPNCKSTFNLIDKVDISAPAIQRISCPVCNQEIWKPSGWILPKRWEVGEIIKRTPDKIPEPQNFGSTIPKDMQKSVYNFKLPDFSAMSESAMTGIKIGGAVVVVIFAIVLILAMRK